MKKTTSRRVAIFGNHSCSNRGDCAIARGLIDWIRKTAPETEIVLYTRFTESARLFLDVPVKRDPLNLFYAKRYGKLNLLLKLVTRKYFALYLSTRLWRIFGLPKIHQEFVTELKEFDLFIQVGGSFFVDVYGISQFEGLFLARIAGVPTVCCGHSVGPFRGRLYQKVAQRAFSGNTRWLLREETSQQLMASSGLPTENVELSGDTAWLISAATDAPARDGFDGKKAIAITVRELAPFDRTLGITQDCFENEIAILADSFIAKGYDVFFVSTCTGLESYWRDDRIVAQRIARRMQNKKGVEVVMDEWSDLELGAFMGKCRLVIATRLHSAILGMRFGAPTLILGYEHKSEGICNRLGLAECNVPLKGGIDSTKLLHKALTILENEGKYRDAVRAAVEREMKEIDRVQTRAMAEYLLE